MYKIKRVKNCLLALLKQYCLELAIFIAMICFSCKLIPFFGDNWIFCATLFLADVLIGLFLCFVFKRIAHSLVKVLAKKNGKILQLSRRNEICMIPKNVSDEGQFLKDFEDILAYCQTAGIKRIFARTHRILVSYILFKYRVNRYNVDKYLDSLLVGNTDVIETTIGKIELTYKGKIINSCNRYNKKIKNWRERVFKETDGYKIVIYLR